MNLKNTCVEVSKSRSMHVWLKLCNKFETWGVIWLSSLWVAVGDKRWSFPTNLPHRSMRVMLRFWWLVDFCNKYVRSLWLMLSPWIIHTLILPPLLASLIPRTFRRYHTPTINLPQNSHHTYLSWHFHSHSEIYCHATFHRSVYYDTLHHCHIA